MNTKKGGLKGIDEVLRNLSKAVEGIKGNITPGLIQTAILIRRDMEDSNPKIPVDLGNLRASWFTVISGGVGESKGGGFKGEDAGRMAGDHAKEIASNKAVLAGDRRQMLIMGFSANYAMFVHENMNAQFSGRPGKKPGRPGSGPKFFENALKRNEKKILQTIKNSIKLK